jgi:sec-independent protein translocase protein TatA
MFYTKPWLDGLIVLLVILLFVGPKRLPALGRSLGHGMREFKDAITGKSEPSDAERAELESQTGAAAGSTAAVSRPAGSASSGAESR